MTSFVAKKVFAKVLGETAENRWGAEDKFFEQVPATRLGRKTGRVKKRMRANPPGITEHDAKILSRVKRRAYYLDWSLFNICGIQFGWGSIIALLPFVGDVIDFFFCLMVIRLAQKVEGGLPSKELMQMYTWAIADLGIGFVPFAGDAADAIMKANTRTAIILENYLRKKGAQNIRKSGQPLPSVDPSDPETFDHLQEEGAPPNVSSQHSRSGNVATSTTAYTHRPQESGVTSSTTEPSRPAQARARDDQRSRSFFSFSSSRKNRPADVEMGETGQRPANRSRNRG